VGCGCAASCVNDTRDSHCVPDGSDDRCVSNPEGLGPTIAEPRCALPAPGTPPPAPEECVPFARVLEFMVRKDEGNCIASGCHGSEGNASVAIFFPLLGPDDLDPCGTYSKLTTTSGSVGLPYVVEDKTEEEGSPPDVNEALQSWMYCNVTGVQGGGFPMPKPAGVIVKQQADPILNWILCGAHGPDGCPETGGT